MGSFGLEGQRLNLRLDYFKLNFEYDNERLMLTN